jgi:hypothetical protein
LPYYVTLFTCDDALSATRDIPLYQIASALGVRPAVTEDLLKAAPTAEALLNLNRVVATS